jgi:hypothetical protein
MKMKKWARNAGGWAGYVIVEIGALQRSLGEHHKQGLLVSK